ncbi:solute carrier family 25 member 40-like [Stylophora pistillata]|uniref:Solute carrier family 25 member 40 n=1 Tax=Stylophora pistillata TaxID=50429 RepID=A0A2B4S626_STYPI|nr:solute carrier family 25 member 40-like [Stylophora pistillata]PFX24846.1 Solute carrier family 25 member 40 [Stylophora pistillata]
MRSSIHSSGKITPLQQMISSGSGALITSLIVTPLDVVKTRLQAQLRPIPKSPCYLFCNGLMDHLCLCANLGSPFRPFPHTLHPPFNSTLDALIKIPRYEGISALWRGLPPTLVMAVPNTMIYFTLYDQLKVLYGFEEGEENFWSPMCSGVTARTASITCISPIEMIRTKLQSRKEFSYKELLSVIKVAIQQGGVLSLWHGLGPTLLRDVPFSAVYWTGYEVLKSKFTEPGFIASFSSGVLSGAMAALITTPFDVVKTHRQMELGELVFKDSSAVKKLPFTFSLIFQLYRESGWRSLFAGGSARLIKVAPACAVMISTYEYSKSFFCQYNLEKVTSATVSELV